MAESEKSPSLEERARRLSKNLLESSRRPEPSRTTIVPGGVCGGDGRIIAAENPIFQSKIVSLQFCGRNPQDSSKNWRGWQGG